MAVEGHRVTLNIYDVSKGLARQLSATFLGKAIEAIWHTGIIVYDNEYYFGAGRRSIEHSPAGSMPHGTPLTVVDLGVTHVTKDAFEMYLQEISPRYTAETYSLLSRNCNNFSNEVAQFLVGTSVPEYLLQLPNEIMSSPMGALMLPMIQNLETAFISGAVVKTPEFSPSTTQPLHSALANSGKSSNDPNSSFEKSHIIAIDNELEDKAEGSKPTEDAILPTTKSSLNGVGRDPLGDARNKVQDEIVKEFAEIMATGTVRVSEAAILATMRVMERLGQIA